MSAKDIEFLAAQMDSSEGLSDATLTAFLRHLSSRLGQSLYLSVATLHDLGVSVEYGPSTVKVVSGRSRDRREIALLKIPPPNDVPEVRLLAEASGSAQRDKTAAVFAELCLSQFLSRSKASVRTATISAKLRSFDIASFLHRLTRELHGHILKVDGLSFFVLDKRSSTLKLRGTTGLVGSPPFQDQRYSLTSESWVSKSYHAKSIIAEYTRNGGLHVGHSVEDVPRAISSRVYVPLSTEVSGDAVENSKRRRPNCVGVLRMVNAQGGDTVRPFHRLDAAILGFLGEVIYVNIESLADRDVEGFDRDVAFHAAASVVDGISKNTALARAMIFGSADGIYPMSPQFKLSPSGSFSLPDLSRALDNAHAFSLDILSQIERANVTDRSTTARNGGRQGTHFIDLLLSSVIQKAVNLIPDIQIWHSVQAKHVDINRIFDEPKPPPVVGRTGELVSVFKNIVDNSVKYSKPDEPITLRIKVTDIGTTSGFVVVEVRDYGIGIDVEDVDKILSRPGVRSDLAIAHKVRGNGLGLWYSRDLVVSHGGDLWVERRDVGLSVFVKLKVADKRGGAVR